MTWLCGFCGWASIFWRSRCELCGQPPRTALSERGRSTPPRTIHGEMGDLA